MISSLQRSLTQETVELLAKHRLIKPLLRQMIISELLKGAAITAEDRTTAVQSFCVEKGFSADGDLQNYLISNLLRLEELEEQLLERTRLKNYITEHYLNKAEARFLQRKTQLDRCVYSLIRLLDRSLARELYFQINEGESDFSELAARYSEGPEKTTRGVVGPAPIAQAHPVLAERLRTATPGEVIEPFQIEKWWLVVRLESLKPATLSVEMAEEMARELFEEDVEEELIKCINQLAPLRFQAA